MRISDWSSDVCSSDLQKFWQREVEMDVPVVTIGGVVFAAIEDSLGGVVQIAVQLEQVTVASRDCPIESVDGAGRSATGGLLNAGLTALFIGTLQSAVEVRRDGAIIEEQTVRETCREKR